MKIILGGILFLLGSLMLLNSLKIYEPNINELTQDKSKGVFDYYDKTRKEYPIIQKVASFTDLTHSINKSSGEDYASGSFFLKNLNIIASVLVILAGVVLMLNMVISPVMISIFAGIVVLAFIFCIRSIRLNLN